MHLEVGQPSTSASRAVLRAAERALSTNILGYTGEAGTESLRKKISDHYQHTYGDIRCLAHLTFDIGCGRTHPDTIGVSDGRTCHVLACFLA